MYKVKYYSFLIVVFVLFVAAETDSCNNASHESAESREVETLADTEVNLWESMLLSDNTFGLEQNKTEENQRRLYGATPPPKLQESLEREQLAARADLWNNPTKIAYVYTLTEYGGIIGRFTIKGKVSSVNSGLTNPEQIVITPKYDTGDYKGRSAHTVSSPQEDGSYGTNGDAIFFFTTSGTYVEWNGLYFLSDDPIPLSESKLVFSME